jgi:haloalkane dehalogenase
MSTVAKRAENEWVDRREYPFASNFFEVDGGRMHYVDEGQGDPVVFVHGTPTWSFAYRRLIRDLSMKHRCIAPDHIGFGLSSKPAHWSYRPESHARNLASLLDHLNLTHATMVVHDFGGPIGLSYALDNPGRIDSLVLMNTWMWPLGEDKHAHRLDTFASGPLGKLMYTGLNYPTTVLMRSLFAQRQKLTRAVHEQYKKPFAKPAEREGPLGMAKGLSGSGSFFYDLWRRREALSDKPTLILWGMKDEACTPAALDRWKTVFPSAQVETFPECGHFVCEEQPNEVAAAVYLFIDGRRELRSTVRGVHSED